MRIICRDCSNNVTCPKSSATRQRRRRLGSHLQCLMATTAPRPPDARNYDIGRIRTSWMVPKGGTTEEECLALNKNETALMSFYGLIDWM